jgi:hypothetical protein
MSMSISSLSGTNVYALGAERNGLARQNTERAQARQALGDALASGDVDAAKAAFDKFATYKAANAGDAHPNGPFAQLQSAMQAGDLEAAKAAYQQLPAFQRAQRPDDGQTKPGGEGMVKAQLATGGLLGTRLNLTA